MASLPVARVYIKLYMDVLECIQHVHLYVGDRENVGAEKEVALDISETLGEMANKECRK